MRTYKVLLPLTVHTEDGSYTQGDTFDKDFTAEQEAENVASGLLELQPAEYKVIGGSRVFETDPGGTFTAAMPLGQEELLVEGGHIELAEPPPKTKAKSKKEEAK